MWGLRRRLACGESEMAWALKLLICDACEARCAMVSTFSIHASILDV